MKRKHWKRIIIGATSIFLLLVLTLFVHIAMVTKPGKINDTRVRALTRININDDLTPEQGAELRKYVASIEGVNVAKYTEKENALVCEINPTLIQSNDIVDKVLKDKKINVEKLVISDAQKMNGCPVLDQSSVSYRLGRFFQDILD